MESKILEKAYKILIEAEHEEEESWKTLESAQAHLRKTEADWMRNRRNVLSAMTTWLEMRGKKGLTIFI